MKEKIDFAYYINEHGDDVWRLCLNLCFSREDSEDLYQDTFARAYEKIESYDRNKPFRKWIYAVCYNVFKNSLRRKSSRPKTIAYSTNEQHDYFINDFSKASEMDSLEMIYDVKKGVDGLPQELRQVIIFYYFDDFSVRDVSEILGISEQVIKNRLFKARQLLKRGLKNYE